MKLLVFRGNDELFLTNSAMKLSTVVISKYNYWEELAKFYKCYVSQ